MATGPSREGGETGSSDPILTEDDAVESIRAAAQTWPTFRREQALADALHRLQRVGFHGVLERLERTSLPEEVLPAVIGAWIQEDAGEALAWARTRPGVSYDALRLVGNRWGASDPVAAWEAGLRLPVGSRRDEFLAAAIGAWSASDPPAAFSRVRSQGLSNLRSTVIGEFFHHWVRRDPVAALDAFRGLPAQDRSGYTLYHFAEGFAKTDQPAAWSWIKTLPPSEDRRIAMENVIGQWEPTGAAAALDLCSEVEGGEQLVQCISARWFSKDPLGPRTTCRPPSPGSPASRTRRPPTRGSPRLFQAS